MAPIGSKMFGNRFDKNSPYNKKVKSQPLHVTVINKKGGCACENGGVLDCLEVQECMVDIIAGIQDQIDAITGGMVTSVSNTDGTLTISPTTGNVIASLNVNHINTWTALQTFGNNISMGGAQLNVAALTNGDLLQYNGTNWINIAASSIVTSTLADVSAASIVAVDSIYTMTATVPVEFRTSDGNTLLYLDETNERVLLGTNTTAAGLLHLYGPEGFQVQTRVVNSAGGAGINMNKSRGSVGSLAIVNNNDVLGSFNVAGYDGSNFLAAAQIAFRVDGTPGTNDMPGSIVFSTTPDGSNILAERFRITNGGILTLGGTTSSFPALKRNSAELQIRLADDSNFANLYAAAPTYSSGGYDALVRNQTTGRFETASVGGSGTVTIVSVVSANGFAGTVATDTTTPAITISTTVTGILKGNGTAISAATAGTDYVTPTGTEALTNKDLTSGTNTFPTFNQNTTGSAATLTTTRTIWGQNFNGSANVSGTLTLGTADLTLTGSIGTTGARATKIWTDALESTAMPTVGGVSLSSTFAAIAGSTSQAFSVSTLDIGNTDTTLARSAAGQVTIEGVQIATISNTVTITNKRIQPRVYSTASNTSLTPEIDTYDIFHITALAGAITINNHSTSTPADGEKIMIRLLDNGTARAISFGTNYVAKAGVALPTTTTLGKNMVMGFEWNANLGKYNLLALGVEA